MCWRCRRQAARPLPISAASSASATACRAAQPRFAAMCGPTKSSRRSAGISPPCRAIRTMSRPWPGWPSPVSMSWVSRGGPMPIPSPGCPISAAGQLEEAASAFDQALTVDPDLAIAHSFSGYNAAFLGHAERTIPAIERAMRLDHTERRHSIFLFFGGFAELLLGRTESAISLLRKSLDRNPAYGSAQLFLMAALLLVGRKSEAARVATAFREQYPESRANDLEQLWLSRSAFATYRAQIDPVFQKIRSFGIGG